VCDDTTSGWRDYRCDKLVLCEVYNTNGSPHETNVRTFCETLEERHEEEDMWFGFEQEYTLLSSKTREPVGFTEGMPLKGDSDGQIEPQGPYYCSVGARLAVGRDLVEEHLGACLRAGLKISGINAEVMPGQWEFQIGPANALEASDHLWVARWMLHRIAEKHDLIVSFDGKPASGDWNGAGCHTNFSSVAMRNSYRECLKAAEKLSKFQEEHIQGYGEGIENRLTGDHETCSYREFKYGLSDRGASVRIPWQVEKDDGGYIEDRRPNANCDPYIVSSLLLKNVLSEERK
jgi:glutamine synthetase